MKLSSCLLSFIFIFLAFSSANAQRKAAFVSGKILDENEQPLSKVSVMILGRQSGILTDDSGAFRISTPSERAFALVFSYTGYKSEQRNFLLNEGEEEKVVLRLERGSRELETVTVTDQRQRREAGLVALNPKHAINIPSPLGGVESLIKVFVGSNNGLTFIVFKPGSHPF